MVRRCVVDGCSESDKTMLAHRFPKTGDMANKWQKALNVENYSIDDLTKKFVVCTKHFTASAYRNEISCCLNTTSVPNLKENTCNHQRAQMKGFAYRKPASLPVRCHSLPEPGKHSPIQFKRIKLDEDLIQTLDEGDIEEVVQVEEEEETFEICEYAEDEPEILENQEIQEIQEIQETKILKELEIPPLLVPQFSVFDQHNQETQTDPLPEVQPTDSVKVIAEIVHPSKDDKLISILYPEFQSLEKLQLIELLNEKSRKIESLEEKVKKLELAMRNLL